MDSVRGTLRIRDVLGTWGTLQTAIHGVHLSYCFLLQPRTLVGWGAGHGGKLSDKSRHYGRKVYFGSSFVSCSLGIAFETVVRESSGGLRKWREVLAASNQRRARSPNASFKGAPLVILVPHIKVLPPVNSTVDCHQ